MVRRAKLQGCEAEQGVLVQWPLPERLVGVYDVHLDALRTPGGGERSEDASAMWRTVMALMVNIECTRGARGAYV